MIARRALAGGVLGAAAFAAGARAQDEAANYPDRPVRVVVPYAPGGGNDIVARLLAQKLGDALRQPFIVENRPGAAAIVGTEAVARARPDGYTLLVAASGPIVFNPATSERLSYDPLTDLTPITALASFPLLVLVAADSPYRTLNDLLNFARANPDRVNYAAPATSFQLAAELLNQRAGTRFQHIAYRGTAECITAVIRGDVTMTLADTAPAAGALQGGRVRALAITSARRHPSFPEVPTMAELGLQGLEVVLWTGLLAPARTPAGIIRVLHERSVEMLGQQDVRDRLAALALDAVGSSPTEFRESIAREIPLWRGVARAANIRLE
jgi:tripartite-type tricarboxylate transporter receptor subunit TctC